MPFQKGHKINLGREGSGMSGRRHSIESKLKLSQAHLGKKDSEETIEKKRQIWKGRSHSETTRDLLRGLATGRGHSEETREKLRVMKTGMQATTETREKMRLSKLAYWQSIIGDRPRVSSQERFLRLQPIYIAWRRAVLKRDGYSCQGCGETKSLQVHHIKSWANFVELRLVVENGITLCVPCHKIANREQRRIECKLPLA